MALWFRTGNTCFGLVQGSWYTASETVAMSQVVRGMGTSFVTFWSSIFGSWNCSKVINVKSVSVVPPNTDLSTSQFMHMTFANFQRIGGGGGRLAAGQGNQPCEEKVGSFAPTPTHPPLERGEGLGIEFCHQWPSSLINSACLLKRPQKPLKHEFCWASRLVNTRRY